MKWRDINGLALGGVPMDEMDFAGVAFAVDQMLRPVLWVSASPMSMNLSELATPKQWTSGNA